MVKVMGEWPVVSVLMPVRDTPVEWLTEAVRSIEQQDYQGYWELVVVNHNCRLGLTQCINELVTNRVTISDESVSFTQALDQGVQACRGEIIVRMDSDDIADPRLVSSVAGYLRDHPDIDVCGVQIQAFGDFDLVSEHPALVTREMAYWMEGYWIANHPGIGMRKSALLEVGGYGDVPNGYAQDYRLWCKFLLSGRVIANLPEVLIKYRTYPKPPRPADHEDFLKAVKEELRIIDN